MNKSSSTSSTSSTLENDSKSDTDKFIIDSLIDNNNNNNNVISIKTRAINNNNNNNNKKSYLTCLLAIFIVIIIILFILFAFLHTYINNISINFQIDTDNLSIYDYSDTDTATTTTYLFSTNGFTSTIASNKTDVSNPNDTSDQTYNVDKCGISYRQSNLVHYLNSNNKIKRRRKRIVNGNESVEHSYPWIVSLHEVNNDGVINSVSHCSGTLISQQHVLTAAHCILDVKRLVAIVGLHKLNTKENHHIYNIVNLTYHRSFSNQPKCCENDIGIVKLEKRVNISHHTRVICLPFDDNQNVKFKLLPNDNVIVAGWGSVNMDYGHKETDKLQETVLTIRDESACKQYSLWNSLNKYCHRNVNENNTPSTPCSGDSGAPLMIIKNGLWYIMGVISVVAQEVKEGKYKCSLEIESISVKLEPYAIWIKENIYY